MTKKLLLLLRNERGNLVTLVIVTAMMAIIGVGIVTAWKNPIKDLNSAATSKLILTSEKNINIKGEFLNV